MARVPKADNFQVLPGVRQGQARAVLSPEQAAAPGRRMMAQGQQMMQVGGAVADYALKQQERVNRIRENNAFLELQREATIYEQEIKNLTGEAAIGAYSEYGKRLEQSASALAADLPPSAREMFLARTGGLQNQFFAIGLRHEAEQLDVMEDNALSARIVASTEMISIDPKDTERVNIQRGEMRAALTEKYQKAGKTGEDLEQAVRTEMGKLQGIIIDNMLDAGDGAGAKAYFEAIRGTDMLETDADALANKVNAGAAVSNGRVLVDAFMADTSMEDLNLVEADAYFRANGTNDKEIDAAREELLTRRRLFQEQEKLQDADNYDTALEIASRNGLGAAKGSAAWQSLRPAEQNAIRDYIESRYETVRSRQAAAETREASATQKQQDDAYYDIIYAEGAPQKLVDMSEGDFRALRSKVGERNFGALGQMRQELQGDPNRITSVSMDNDKFAELADRYGYNPFTENKEEKLEITILRSKISDEIAAAQSAAGGRELGRDIRDAIIENAFARGALPARLKVREGIFSGQFGGRKIVTTDEITLEQISRIRISDIPKEEKRQIIEALGAQYNKTADERFNPEIPSNVIAMYLSLRGVEVTE